MTREASEVIVLILIFLFGIWSFKLPGFAFEVESSLEEFSRVALFDALRIVRRFIFPEMINAQECNVKTIHKLLHTNNADAIMTSHLLFFIYI